MEAGRIILLILNGAKIMFRFLKNI
jgi:hypothetical protein